LHVFDNLGGAAALNWRKWTIIILISIFVVMNFYLIFKKDSAVARSKYIDEWTEVKEQNLIVSKHKEGVVAPLEEQHVYFQSDAGVFEQFLVDEGEEVQAGTPLFEYSSTNAEETMDKLDTEIERLESEKDALEDNIDNLERIERSLSNSTTEENLSKEAVASSIEAQIYEKELQLSRIEGEIDKYEELVSIANNGLSNLNIQSPISGVVRSISHDLQNPIVTITSNEQQVKGILEEDEVLAIEEGMKVVITSKKSPGKLEGTISKVAVNPNDKPQVDKQSQYEFTVQFAEVPIEEQEVTNEEKGDEAGELMEPAALEVFTGAHVDIKIITKEVENALTVSEKTMRDHSIFVLKGNGTIEKRPIETGIEVNNVHEVTSDVEKGELIVLNPSKIRNNTTFFTQVDISDMKKKDFTQMGKKEILKYVGRGILSR
jgi:HlyD family secretion protein